MLTEVLGAGRHRVPRRPRFAFSRRPVVEIVLVDVRERELTIRGQEILTSDKVAVRVSILTQFKVTDPVAAVDTVESYEDRLYSDVQLAARRSLASMTLEAILTNRNELSEDILRDVQDAASGYGVTILRADVKDLVFPGNLQEIMNRVLTAQRLSEAQLIEARTRAEAQQIEARAQAEVERVASSTRSEGIRRAAEADADASRIRLAAEVKAIQARSDVASAFAEHPALLRLRELEALSDLASTASARLYIDFDRPTGRHAPDPTATPSDGTGAD